MILDNYTKFSDGQDLTGGTGEDSDDELDLTNQQGYQIGLGEVIKITIHCDTDFAGGTSMDFRVQQSNTVGNRSIGRITIAQIPVIPLASLTKGALFSMNVPIDQLNPVKQNLFLRYNKSGTFTGACLVTAGIVIDEQTQRHGWPASTGFH